MLNLSYGQTPVSAVSESLLPQWLGGWGGGASNNVEARLDCSDWGHWLWYFDLLISPRSASQMWHLRCGANLRQLWTIVWLTESEAARNVGKENYTYLNRMPIPALLQPSAWTSTHMCLYMCTCAQPLFCERPCVCLCVIFFVFFASVYVCGWGLWGRTEWIYKLMEFKASSIDYHYNKQQHTECLIIFRQRFCALSSNSADAVTLSDIRLWLQLDGIQKEK